MVSHSWWRTRQWGGPMLSLHAERVGWGGLRDGGASGLIVATSQRAAGRFDDEEAMIIMDPRLAPGGYAGYFQGGWDSQHGHRCEGGRCSVGGRGGRPCWISTGDSSISSAYGRYRGRSIQDDTGGGGLVRARGGGAYLVGDAVGSVIPTNGGAGINPAMITGKLVVDSMIQGIDYYSLLYSVFGSFMKRMVDYRKLADPILYDYEAVKRLLKFPPKPLLRTALRDAVMGGSSKASTSLMLGILSPLINSLVASQRKH